MIHIHDFKSTHETDSAEMLTDPFLGDMLANTTDAAWIRWNLNQTKIFRVQGGHFAVHYGRGWRKPSHFFTKKSEPVNGWHFSLKTIWK